MNSVIEAPSAEAVEGLLALVNAQGPILDVTYGSGDFWVGSTREVYGCDIDPQRAKNQVADFRNLPFTNGQFPTVIFDPPFHPYVGSAEEEQFKGMGKNDKELRTQFDAGLKECWRVTSRHLLVKCQGFVHNHALNGCPYGQFKSAGSLLNG